MSKIMKKTMIAAIASLALAGGVWYALKHTSKQANPTAPAVEKKPANELNTIHFAQGAPQLAYIKISTVALDALPSLEPLQGRITYDEDVTSRISAPINGRVIKIHAQMGEHVKAGQALVTLDAPDFAQASAEVRSAEADLHLKQSAYERSKMLSDGGVLARKDLDAASSDLEQSRIEVDRTHERMRNLGIVGNDGFVLRSRVSGIVTERQINPGSEVRSDSPNPLFVVSDPSHLWIDVQVPEKDLGKMHEGQHVNVLSDAYPDSFDAVVLLIGSVMDPATRRVMVRCRVNNVENKLKPEMFVHVTPVSTETKLPHVPNSAIVTEGVKNFVFVEKSPGVLEKRLITEAYRGHEESYISAGVNAGDRVAVSGALLLNAELSGN